MNPKILFLAWKVPSPYFQLIGTSVYAQLRNG